MKSELHEKVFQFCKQYRAKNPEFRYWLRTRNEKNRLENGLWFQGTEEYASVGLFNRDSGNQSTKSFSLLFRNKDGQISLEIEIIFRSEQDPIIIAFYKESMDMIGGFKENSPTHYRKIFDSENAFSAANDFLNTYKNDLDALIRKKGIEHIFITEDSFKKKFERITNYRNQSEQGSGTNINYIIVNITWNSKNWTEPTTEESTHRYVAEGNIAHESWNFDFENPRNTQDHIYGYSQFTNPPKVTGDNNLIIFSSQNQIVGFYGMAEVLNRPYDEALKVEENYNLAGKKALSLCLDNKITNMKEKGYLEDNKRIGQIGFSYLKSQSTILKIIDEAIELNPAQEEKLTQIKDWIIAQKEETLESNYWVFQANPTIYNVVEALKDGALKSWSVTAHKKDIKIGDKIILWKVGENPGCYALCRVTSEIRNRKDDEIEQKYYNDLSNLEPIDRVSIEVEANLWNRPILKNQVINLPEFENFKAGRQGTNFSATKEEYLKLFELANIMENSSNSLNFIMFGPPGTGKTYHTVGEAMKIVAPSIYTQYSTPENRNKLREEFTRMLIKDWADPKGKIAFCTFHQSFSYEDFVEGIKPKTSDKQEILYEMEDGVFKQICELAESNLSTIKVIKEGKFSWSPNDFRKASFYKVSLGDVTKPNDNEIYEYCRDNGYIAIGSGDNNDFTGLSENQIEKKCNDLEIKNSEAQQLKYFIHYLKTGNYVIVSHGNKFMRAIGKVTGDYEFIENSPIRYNHFRKVEWLFVDEKIPVEEVYDRPFTQNTIYKIDQNGLKEDFFTGRGQKESVGQREDKKYVLIIDEINRGNIANIFGELITLIENDKRAGKKEALEVILPYSKKKFSVPANLYIIGTMNTADRSIEALDTALRRRFSFREMPPRPELIKSEGALKDNDGHIGEIDLVLLLKTINKRLEKLIDKDHRIGHSYFMHIKTEPELKIAFKDKVIPLLEEYFFGDFGKIGLVLGSSFVEKLTENAVFATFDEYGDAKQDLAERPVYKIKDPNDWDFISIYQ